SVRHSERSRILACTRCHAVEHSDSQWSSPGRRQPMGTMGITDSYCHSLLSVHKFANNVYCFLTVQHPLQLPLLHPRRPMTELELIRILLSTAIPIKICRYWHNCSVGSGTMCSGPIAR